MNRFTLAARLAGVNVAGHLSKWAARQGSGTAAIEAYRSRRLGELIRRAADLSSPGSAYDSVLGRLDPTNYLEVLQELPVTQATGLFLADSGSGENRGRLFRRETAGTNGVPRVTYLDRESLGLRLAARSYAFSCSGVGLGEREARFWGRPDEKLTRNFRERLLNRRVFQFLNKSSNLNMAEAKSLANFDPRYLYGYSSLLVRAAQTWRDLAMPALSIRMIVATAECLNRHQRVLLEEAFHAPVRLEYGCTEADIIAFECPYGTCHVVEQNVILEVDGQDGSGEAIVTDLTNLASPLIRYRLGDFVQLGYRDCACGVTSQTVESIQGRVFESTIDLPGDRTIHSVDVAVRIEALVDRGVPIEQFHLRQHSLSRFTLTVMLGPGWERFGDLHGLIADSVRQVLGSECELNLERVDNFKHSGTKHTYFSKADDLMRNSDRGHGDGVNPNVSVK